jgi:hypothetical protein
MSTVNVQDIATLQRFRAALSDLVMAAQPILETVPRRVQQLGNQFEAANDLWTRRLSELQEHERYLNRQVQFCMQSGDRDHPPDCRELEHQAQIARLEVLRAEKVLFEIRRMHDAVSRSVEEYGRAARPLTHVLNERIPVESPRLQQAAEYLTRYIGLSVRPVDSLSRNVWSAPSTAADAAVRQHQPHAGGHPEAQEGRVEGEPAREAPEMGRRGPLLAKDEPEAEPWGELPPMSRR